MNDGMLLGSLVFLMRYGFVGSVRGNNSDVTIVILVVMIIMVTMVLIVVVLAMLVVMIVITMTM